MKPMSASGPHESRGGVFRTTRFRSAAATAKRKKMSVTNEISRKTALVATNEIPQKTTAMNAPRRGGMRIDAIVAAAVVILHLICINQYGYFRDELYFIACSKHLAWGYVDQPPMIALLIWIARHLFGESLLALPNIVWQYRHHFPMLELLHNIAQSGKNEPVTPLSFILGNAILMNPVTLPLWAAGAVWLVMKARYRWLGVAFFTLLVWFIVMKGKIYYFSPMIPVALAAGRVAIDKRVPVGRSPLPLGH